MGADRALQAAIRAALAEHADGDRAAGQQAYMKSAMPFAGVSSAVLATALRPLLAAPLPDRQVWVDTIATLWDEAIHREEWYAAIALARHKHYVGWRDAGTMSLWCRLLVTGAWWDVVDDLAIHVVGPVLLADPAAVRPVLLGWALGDDRWLRRAAIICQNAARGDTDRALLAEVVGASLEPELACTPLERDFFVRKAIGWALREHARTDPDWVRRFVTEHESELSGLSRREALKHLR